MAIYEYAGNLHNHTPYSDGEAYHAEIAKAAQVAGLDFVVVTDHNILVKGVEGYYGHETGKKPVLLLTGEEVHDRTRHPQVNHTLIYGVDEELAMYAENPQELIARAIQAGGMAFLAHPYDKPIPWLPGEMGIGIPWVNWEVARFTGLEIWNYMAVWKDTLPTVRQAPRSIFRPEDVMIAPRQETLNKWDELLARGQRVVGIGGADAHGNIFHLGPVPHVIFPYDFLYMCVNTHVLTGLALSGELEEDRKLLFDALQSGHAFIGYDLIHSTRGFRFSAQGESSNVGMGDAIRLATSVTLQVLAPERGLIKIIRHGELVAENDGSTEALTYIAREPGAYRVEVWREFKGTLRMWILSNPIYVMK